MIWVLGIAALAFALFEVYVQTAGTDSIPGYARSAGFPGGDLAVAVAIAYAESSGISSKYNKEAQDVPGRYNRESADDGLGSYGLWQIYLAAHPEFSGQDLTDPQTNANAAFAIYQAAGNSFSPWTTYKTGAYIEQLSRSDVSPLIPPEG